ncbi:biotin--[acetyl-CoA-carboxylase] ligase [Ruminococcaceae bacterium OttesenSCG-928-D13]|nr:biotin--[acetyl-CoA-carboxylase] ligase [Ruminococcaceae bacterium OttesenSCG-928-D13]
MMSTKSGLLALLEKSRDGVVSGEEAARRLGVSRAAVWKAAEALRRQGVAVESLPGSGYRLAAGSDALSAEAVRAWLDDPDTPLRVLAAVDSTNLEAKRWAIEGAPHGALVVAEKQTAGRGRLGRSFESPPGGLYLSVVLRPSPAQCASAGLVTSAAAVAGCRAVSALCGIELGIKWVNDLFYGGKKCCGILTEAVTDVETGAIEQMVVGIGINYTTPEADFPPEVRQVATALFPHSHRAPVPHPRRAPVPRAQLAAQVHRELLALFAALPGRDFLEEYRRRSIVVGRPVTVLASPPWNGLATGIDDDARLLVRNEAGDTVVVSYGEVSVRL